MRRSSPPRNFGTGANNPPPLPPLSNDNNQNNNLYASAPPLYNSNYYNMPPNFNNNIPSIPPQQHVYQNYSMPTQPDHVPYYHQHHQEFQGYQQSMPQNIPPMRQHFNNYNTAPTNYPPSINSSNPSVPPAGVLPTPSVPAYGKRNDYGYRGEEGNRRFNNNKSSHSEEGRGSYGNPKRHGNYYKPYPRGGNRGDFYREENEDSRDDYRSRNYRTSYQGGRDRQDYREERGDRDSEREVLHDKVSSLYRNFGYYELKEFIEASQKSSCILIEDADKKTTKTTFLKFFNLFGPVKRVVPCIDMTTSEQTGFCFVEFFNKEIVDAIFNLLCIQTEKIGKLKLNGKPIHIRRDVEYREGREKITSNGTALNSPLLNDRRKFNKFKRDSNFSREGSQVVKIRMDQFIFEPIPQLQNRSILQILEQTIAGLQKNMELLNEELSRDENSMLPSFLPPMHEQMQKMKARLNDTKKKWESFDPVEWSKQTAMLNKTGLVSKFLRSNIQAELCDSIWTKFYEIYFEFEKEENKIHLIPEDCKKENKLHSLHLNEVRGSSICALNHLLKTTDRLKQIDYSWNATKSPLLSDEEGVFANVDSLEKEYPDLFSFQDLNDLQQIKTVWAKYQKEDIKLITADGSVVSEVEKESRASYLKFCEVITALRILSMHGSFIIKLHTLFERSSIGLLYLLYRFFDQITLCKPVTSKEGSSEIYLVCLGYKLPSAVNVEKDNSLESIFNLKEQMIQLMLSMAEKMQQKELIKYYNPVLPVSEIPDEFLIQTVDAADSFSQKLVQAIERNISLFNEKLSVQQSKSLSQQKKATALQFIQQLQLKPMDDPFNQRIVTSKYLDGGFIPSKPSEETSKVSSAAPMQESSVGVKRTFGEISTSEEQSSGAVVEVVEDEEATRNKQDEEDEEEQNDSKRRKISE